MRHLLAQKGSAPNSSPTEGVQDEVVAVHALQHGVLEGVLGH